jgi:hypothetical protein
MKNGLRAFYKPSEDEFKSAWEEATFVLDTNILFNLYRYSLQPRNELLAILTQLGDRVWMPFHVGLEYQRNRLTVIKQQQARISEVTNDLKAVVPSLRQKIGGKQPYAIINAEPLLEEMDQLVKRFASTLPDLQTSHVITLNNDTIRDQLDVLFNGRVGKAPTSEQLDVIKKSADFRYPRSIPPGYADATKEKKFYHGGLEYDEKLGDYIIWSQILDHAKDNKIQKIIFLTDDEKEDWCSVVEAPGAKVREPRVELVDEIQREAQVSFFYIYNSGNFLKFAKQYLAAKVQDTSIDQVADVLEMQRPTAGVFSDHFARYKMAHPDSDKVRLAMEWLDTSPTARVAHAPGGRFVQMTREGTADVEIVVAENEYVVHAALHDLLLPSTSLERPHLLILVGHAVLDGTAAQVFKQFGNGRPHLLQSVVYGAQLIRHPKPGDEQLTTPGHAYRGTMVFEPQMVWQGLGVELP